MSQLILAHRHTVYVQQMPWHISVTIPAIPVAQPRPRATSRNGIAKVYEVKHIGTGESRRPHPVAAFKATVRQCVAEAWEHGPIDGPICLDLTFVFPRPKSMIWKKRPMPRALHTKKPDRDNVDKAVMDALSGLLWRDDCQICDGRIRKYIAAGDESPHVELELRRMDDGDIS